VQPVSMMNLCGLGVVEGPRGSGMVRICFLVTIDFTLFTASGILLGSPRPHSSSSFLVSSFFPCCFPRFHFPLSSVSFSSLLYVGHSKMAGSAGLRWMLVFPPRMCARVAFLLCPFAGYAHVALVCACSSFLMFVCMSPCVQQ